MCNGWIKLHRKILEWEWYDDTSTFRVFVHLLLTANTKDSNWKGLTIKRGQTLTTLPKIATETALTIRQVRSALEHLTSTQEVTRETTNRFTILTVCNYDSYQQCPDQVRQANDTKNVIQTADKTTDKRQTESLSQPIETEVVTSELQGSCGRQTTHKTTDKRHAKRQTNDTRNDRQTTRKTTDKRHTESQSQLLETEIVTSELQGACGRQTTHETTDKRQTTRQANDTRNDNTIRSIRSKEERNKEITTITSSPNVEEEIGSKEISVRASALSPLPQVSKAFYDSLVPFLGIYPKEMIREFYDYWSEPNRSGTKIRMQLERTWDLKRRLNTWASRDKKFRTYGNSERNICDATQSTKEERDAHFRGYIARKLAGPDDESEKSFEEMFKLE